MTELIAELSTNHGGSRYWLERMLDDAAEARFDVVKTQSHQVRHLRKDDRQYAWMAKAELSDQDHGWLLGACASRGLRFLTTVFNASRVRFLADLGLPAIKIGSGEAMDRPLLEAVAAHPWKVYLSTGLVTWKELEAAIDILHGHHLVMMHTTSKYPTLPHEVDMDRLDREMLSVGYSDHTVGLDAAKLAMALGLTAVEVHVRSTPGDRMILPRMNEWDKSPADMRELVRWRDVVAEMMRPAPVFSEGEERPFVGRWQHESTG